MRLTAFHTPDGLFCWNRLLMGAKPSSAVQKSAYLEALDDYIDFYEDGSLRKCLMDDQGNRLKDAEGNLKTLRHNIYRQIQTLNSYFVCGNYLNNRQRYFKYII